MCSERYQDGTRATIQVVFDDAQVILHGSSDKLPHVNKVDSSFDFHWFEIAELDKMAWSEEKMSFKWNFEVILRGCLL